MQMESNPFGNNYNDYVEEDFSINLVDVPENFKDGSAFESSSYGAVPEESEKTELLTGFGASPMDKATTWFQMAKTATTDLYGVVSDKVSGATQAPEHRDVEMDRRERELADRERHLTTREASMGIVAKTPNWPFNFYPLVYHNIKEDIPQRYQSLMHRLYLCLLADWTCMLWNWLVIFSAVFSGALSDGADSDALWATLYLLGGIPCAWRFWYSKAYQGSRDSATGPWMVFFIGFTVHTMFCSVMALGVPGTASGGLFFMFKMVSQGAPLTALLSFICSAMWAAEAAASVVLLKAAHAQWRTGGEMNFPQTELQVASVAMDAARHL